MKEPVPVGGGGPETEISAIETFKTKMQKYPECRASAKGIRVEARVLSSLLASCKIYLVQIGSRAHFVPHV